MHDDETANCKAKKWARVKDKLKKRGRKGWNGKTEAQIYNQNCVDSSRPARKKFSCRCLCRLMSRVTIICTGSSCPEKNLQLILYRGLCQLLQIIARTIHTSVLSFPPRTASRKPNFHQTARSRMPQQHHRSRLAGYNNVTPSLVSPATRQISYPSGTDSRNGTFHVIWPHGAPQTRPRGHTNHPNPSDTPNPHQPAFLPPTARKCNFHHICAKPHGIATSTVLQQTGYNNVTPSLVDTANLLGPKARPAFTPACSPSPAARTCANALADEAAQNHTAQRHHRRNLATRRATDGLDTTM